MDYLAYHAIVGHFDHMRGFENVQALIDAIWRWLTFCTDDDKSAMGPVLFRKPTKFAHYVEQLKNIDEIVLWVILYILCEPIGVFLKDKFWIMTVDHDLSNVHALFAYGEEGRHLPIVCMAPDEMPLNVPGEIECVTHSCADSQLH